MTPGLATVARPADEGIDVGAKVRWVRALLLVVLCCAVTSCDGVGTTDTVSVSVTRDDALEAALRRASSEGTTVRLADLTDFSWTQVHVFSEGATPEEVREAVGEQARPAILELRQPRAG